MSGAPVFLTYLWHYLVARTLYDQVLRPLIHGRASASVVLVLLAAGFAVGRITRRHA